MFQVVTTHHFGKMPHKIYRLGSLTKYSDGQSFTCVSAPVVDYYFKPIFKKSHHKHPIPISQYG